MEWAQIHAMNYTLNFMFAVSASYLKEGLYA